MRIPYLIDNQQHRLADVLNEVLAEHAGRSLDTDTLTGCIPISSHSGRYSGTIVRRW